MLSECFAGRTVKACTCLLDVAVGQTHVCRASCCCCVSWPCRFLVVSELKRKCEMVTYHDPVSWCCLWCSYPYGWMHCSQLCLNQYVLTALLTWFSNGICSLQPQWLCSCCSLNWMQGWCCSCHNVLSTCHSMLCKLVEHAVGQSRSKHLITTYMIILSWLLPTSD